MTRSPTKNLSSCFARMFFSLGSNIFVLWFQCKSVCTWACVFWNKEASSRSKKHNNENAIDRKSKKTGKTKTRKAKNRKTLKQKDIPWSQSFTAASSLPHYCWYQIGRRKVPLAFWCHKVNFLFFCSIFFTSINIFIVCLMLMHS